MSFLEQGKMGSKGVNTPDLVETVHERRKIKRFPDAPNSFLTGLRHTLHSCLTSPSSKCSWLICSNQTLAQQLQGKPDPPIYF